MSSGIKVAELFASLGIEIDEASMAKADKWLRDQARKAEGLNIGKKVNAQFGKAIKWAAIGVSGVLIAGAKDALEYDKALGALNIAADGATGSIASMHGEFLNLSQSTGIAKEELVAAAQTYFDLTGDAKGTAAAVAAFTRVSTASGTSMVDVTAAASALREQFGIMPEGMEQAFSSLITGGKEGAVSLKNMATLTSSLAAKFKAFGGATGNGGVATLGALFQATMKDSKNAEEAAVNLENLFAKVKSRRRELAAIGVKVENGKLGSGKFKDIITIIKLMDAAQAKNFGAFQDAFGADMQANAGFDALRKRLPIIDEMIEKTRTSKAVAIDLEKRQAQASFRATKAWNDVKVALARAFTPERVEALARAIERVLGIVERVIDAVGGVDNAVIALIATFAALKGAQMLGFLGTLAAKLWGVAAASAAANGVAGGIGKMGIGAIATGGAGIGGAAASAGLVGLAGGVGYGAGTLADKATGVFSESGRSLSDRFSGTNNHEYFGGITRIQNRVKQGYTPNGATINMQSSLTVNATGTDPAGVVKLAEDSARRVHEQTLRETQAAALGGT